MRLVLSEHNQSLLQVPEKLLTPAALTRFLTLLFALFLLSLAPTNTTNHISATATTEQTFHDTEWLTLPDTERRLYEAGLGMYLDFYETNTNLSETFGSGLFMEIYQVLDAVAHGRIDENHHHVVTLRDGWATKIDRSGMLAHARSVIENLPDDSFGAGTDPQAVRVLLYSTAEQAPGFFVPAGFEFVISDFFDGNMNVNGKSNGRRITMGSLPQANIGTADLRYRTTFDHEKSHGFDGQRLDISKIDDLKPYVPLEAVITYITQHTESTYGFLKKWVLLPSKVAIQFDAAITTNWNYNAALEYAAQTQPPNSNSTDTELTSAAEKKNVFLRQEIAKWIEFLEITETAVLDEIQEDSLVSNETKAARFLAWRVAQKLAADPTPQLRHNPLISSLIYGKFDANLNIAIDGIVQSVDHSFVHAPDSPNIPRLTLFREYYDLVNAARDQLVGAKHETPERISIVDEPEKSLFALTDLGVEIIDVYQYAPDDARLCLYRLHDNPFTPEFSYFFIEFAQRLKLHSNLPDSVINPYNFIVALPSATAAKLDFSQLTFNFNPTDLDTFVLQILYQNQPFAQIYPNAYGEFVPQGDIIQVVSITPETILTEPVLNQEVQVDYLLVPQGVNEPVILEIDQALAQYFTPGFLSLFPLPDDKSRKSALPFLLFPNATHHPAEEDSFIIYDNMLLPHSNVTDHFKTGYFNSDTNTFVYNTAEFSFDSATLAEYLHFRMHHINFNNVFLEEKITSKVEETPDGVTVQYYLHSTLKDLHGFTEPHVFSVKLNDTMGNFSSQFASN